jgi:RNA polymerase sigma-54 factor
MTLGPKLQVRQSQSLVMTPQLMQSIRLLQLTHLELERFIEGEIERNPLLERAEEDGDERAAGGPEMPAQDADGRAGERGADPLESSAEAISGKLDASLENLFPDDPGTHDRLSPDLAAQWKSAAGRGQGAATEGFDPGDLAAPSATLGSHVAEQIAFAFIDPAQRLIATELAGELDDAGYLRSDLDEFVDRLGTERDAVADVLSICQSFDPPGLFARSLRECLALQLAVRNRLDPAMAALLDNLDLLARRDFQALQRRCGVDQADLLDMLMEIRALDPKPGLLFSAGPADPITPDVMVRSAPDGGWVVELNQDTLPRVLVDHSYFARVSGHAKGPHEKEFLTTCMQNANWLARSLEQRATTILKVASEIVQQQDGFLAHGVRHLRPLNLRAVADAIGMHESTVSRVTANKYMQTPRGVFELRYFFTAAIASAEGGDAHSAEAVRDRIRQMIAGERPAEVLSDDAIVDILRNAGVEIARRTVAKYREAMNIPSSVQRRREKRALARAEG